MKYFLLLIILTLFSCTRDTWKITNINKFIGNQKIDSTLYNSFDNLAIHKKIIKISTSDSLNNNIGNSFRLPFVSFEKKEIFIAKKCFTNYRKQVFIRLNKNGEIQDSIIVNKNVKITNDYIVDDDFYYTWFSDNSTEKKRFNNINFRSDADSLKVNAIITDLKKNKVPFSYSSNFYDESSNGNYIITFNNNQLVKYVYTANISEKYYDIITEYSLTENRKIKELSTINNDNLFKIDNYFAKTYNELIEGNSLKGFNPTGGANTCDYCVGTCFFTLSNSTNLKLKIDNQNFCGHYSNIVVNAKNLEVYTEDFLNCYLINVNFEEWKNPMFYIIPK